MNEIRFEPAGQMNLLGYFLRAVIQRNLQHPAAKRAFQKMRGRLLIGASQMRVILHFDKQQLTISAVVAEDYPKADVCAQGSLDTLLGIALGVGFIRPIISGKLKVSGKIWRLLPMLKLLKTQQDLPPNANKP